MFWPATRRRSSSSTTAAARLLGAAEALRQVLGRSRSAGERATNVLIADSIRAAIGENAFAAAWAGGRGFTIEKVVATALATTGGAYPGWVNRHGTGSEDAKGEPKTGIDVPGKRLSI